MRNLVATCSVLVGLAGLSAAFAACGSSNAAAGPAGDDGGALDASDAAVDTGVDSNLPVYLEAGIFQTAIAIQVPGAPISMAYDPANHQLFAGLSTITDAGFVVPEGAGIAVVDGRSKKLTTVIGEPDGGAPANEAIVAFAIDPGANKTYATDGANVYVIDGTSLSITQTIAAPNTVALAVDPATHDLYVLGVASASADGAALPPQGTVSVFDATGTATGSKTLDDLTFAIPAPIASLAFEPTSHHLYVCGTSTTAEAGATAAVDTLDVTSNLSAAPQQTFPGTLFGCIAGFGGGALVTNNPSGSINFFDPVSVAMPAIFNPLVMTPNILGTPGSIFLAGVDFSSNGLAMIVASDGTILLQPTPAGTLPQPSDIQTIVASEPEAQNTEGVFLAIEPGSVGVPITADQIIWSEVQVR